MYRLIPCRHGVCASPSTATTSEIEKNKSTKGIKGVILLPGGIEHDTWVQDEPFLPESTSLGDKDIENLRCSDPDNFSFTHYGPKNQDKPTNQDFALSGRFADQPDRIARFSILADGISNGFAFPQRGAQLSCFAAYRCLQALYKQLVTTGKSLSKEDVEGFRVSLAKEINDSFDRDRKDLLYLFKHEHREPSNIASKVWEKYFKDEPEKWYGNTLLISFLSPFGVFISYAGDGGIIFLKGQELPKNIIRSSESSAIDRFVTLGVKSGKFTSKWISRDDDFTRNDGFIEIISVTDGIDRTYQMNEMDLSKAFSSEAVLGELVDQIKNLQDRITGDVDVDNYSIGRVFLPLSDTPHNRMTGNAEPAPIVDPKKIKQQENPPTPITPQDDSDSNEAESSKKKAVACRGMKKIHLAQILLGVALGLGLSNALIIGVSKMNSEVVEQNQTQATSQSQAKEITPPVETMTADQTPSVEIERRLQVESAIE